MAAAKVGMKLYFEGTHGQYFPGQRPGQSLAGITNHVYKGCYVSLSEKGERFLSSRKVKCRDTNLSA